MSLVKKISIYIFFFGICIIGCRDREHNIEFVRFIALGETIFEAASPIEERILKIKNELKDHGYSDELYHFYRSGGPEDIYLTALKCMHFPGMVTEDDRRYMYNVWLDHQEDLRINYVLTTALFTVFDHEGKFEQAQSVSLQYINHSFASGALPDSIIKYRDHVIKKAISSYAREPDVTPYYETMNWLFDLLSTKEKNNFSGYMVKSRMIPEENLSMFKSYLDSALYLANTPNDIFNAHFNLGFYHLMNGDDQQHYHLKKACEVYGGSSCSMHRFYPAIYGLIAPRDSMDENYYNALIDYSRECPDFVRDKLNFSLFNYLEPAIFNFTPRQQLDTLLGVRRLAERLYPGRSTLHLQDFYITNLEQLFSIYRKNPSMLPKADVLLAEVLDTRLKEKYRKGGGVKFVDPEIKNRREAINEKLLKLNYFQNLPPFPNSIYKELFQLYLHLDMNTEPVISKGVLAYSYNEIQEELMESETALINVTKGLNDYCVYHLDGHTMDVSFASVEWVDSIGTILLQQFKDPHQEIDTHLIVSLKDTLGLHTDREHLVCISDGILSVLPIDQIADRRVDVYQDINTYIERNSEIMITKDGLVAYSFSDPRTISSREVREVPELVQGYEECRDIVSLTSSRMVAGYDFTASKLFEDEAISWAHISTHAFSSTENILDNRIICRGYNTTIDPIYAYELTTKKHIPQVVVLSACETGSGIHKIGAGVQTLSRSLLDNGAVTVVKSLWKVNEAATYDFMIYMYTQLSEGHSIAKSLELSKSYMQTSDRFSHPYYWAGLVLEGNPEVYLH